MNKHLMAAVAAALSLAAGAAHAVEVRPLLTFGLTGGGDTLGELVYEDNSRARVSSGALFAFGGGLEFGFGGPLSLQLNATYHFDKVNASNMSVTFSRIPIELLGHYRVSDDVRIGGGLRHSTGTKLSVSGNGGGSVDFKPSTGFVLEGEYMQPNSSWGAKLRVVSEEFKLKNFNGPAIDGTHIGGYLTYYFR